MVEIRQLRTTALDRPTAASAVPELQAPPAPAEQLIPRGSALRYEADTVNGDTVELARKVYLLSLAQRTTEREREGVRTLLQALSEKGFSWSMTSRMLGVSVPAIRKWRLGEGASPENRHSLARLAGLVDMLADQFMIEDPTAWLEIPLAGVRTSLADVYAGGRVELILEYASRWIVSPEQVLDEFNPQWRAGRDAREFETFTAADGEISIRRAGVR